MYYFLDILDRTLRAGSTWQKCARFSPRVFEFLPMLTRTSHAGSTERFSPRVCKFWVEQNKLGYISILLPIPFSIPVPFPVPFPISPSLALYLSCYVFLLCKSLSEHFSKIKVESNSVASVIIPTDGFLYQERNTTTKF